MPTPPANWPVPLPSIGLRGQIVQLELLATTHEPELLKICQDAQIWRYLTSYGGTPDTMRDYVHAALRDYVSGFALPFVIRATSSGSVIDDAPQEPVAYGQERRRWFLAGGMRMGQRRQHRIEALAAYLRFRNPALYPDRISHRQSKCALTSCTRENGRASGRYIAFVPHHPRWFATRHSGLQHPQWGMARGKAEAARAVKSAKGKA